MQMFEQGVCRGAAFKVLTNSLAATNKPQVHWSYMRYRRSMLRLGMELFELSPILANRDHGYGLFGSQSLGWLQAKAAIVDNTFMFIGSMNFDSLLGRLQHGNGIMIECPKLAAKVQRLMRQGKQRGSSRSALRRRMRRSSGSSSITTLGRPSATTNRMRDADFAIRAHF